MIFWKLPLCLFLAVLLCESVQASALLPRAVVRRGMSTSTTAAAAAATTKSIDFNLARERLIRLAYNSALMGPMDPKGLDDLMRQHGEQIHSATMANVYREPLLMIAVKHDNVPFVRSWLESGLDVHGLSWDSRNAWHCYGRSNKKMLELLEAAGISKNIVESRTHFTPVWYILKAKGHFEIAAELLESGTFTEGDFENGSAEVEEILKEISRLRALYK